jgi:hypothetical protein
MLRGAEPILAGWGEVGQLRQGISHAQSPGLAVWLVKAVLRDV